ncbi:DUF1850 domain-containing protein [Acetomicrobium sp. S15 = DSM 107314]|uniref:DUF1850 domain-containing protein n=1 Tax=Acetomicrobium sp. S15 = DSM 107314 TaxID=2529858 RepID=UPI0018E13FA3|nr:DUF1850 domain-containing protein [Acetomicrobium sp. S15 = DSM 107314]
MPKTKRLLFVIVLSSTAVVFFCPVSVLTIRDANDTIVYAVTIGINDTFSIKFTHSVAKRPVVETFGFSAGKKITLLETEYDSFGAGLPFEVKGGQRFIAKDGKFKIVGYNYEVPDLVIRVGRFADHLFVFRGEEIRLVDLAKAGEALVFSVEEVPLLWYVSERFLQR